MAIPFLDRSEAGRFLATKLVAYRDRSDVIVLALPRGGVPVAAEVARALNALLDVFIVRKIGVPGQEELAMGAIASGGTVVLNHQVIAHYNIPESLVKSVTERERLEVQRREELYREGAPYPDLKNRTVILIDDGLATGASMRAALAALRRRGPATVLVAVPTAAQATCQELHELADGVICVQTPDPFNAVGCWYRAFPQVTDEEVHAVLQTFKSGALARAARGVS